MINEIVKIDDENLKKILLAQGYILADDIKMAEKITRAQDISFVDYLLSKGLITKNLLGQAVAEFCKVPYADLDLQKPSEEQVKKIDEEFARKFRVVLFRIEGDHYDVATDNPTRAGLVDEIKNKLQAKEVELYYALPEGINDVFAYYRKTLNIRFDKILEKNYRVAPEIINEIIEDAVLNKASDIHFEPLEKEVIIRFRVDGVLQEAGFINKETYENILNRIKVQAQLRIDQHMAAQDGAIRIKNEKFTVDMRISIVPTINGEKIVIRLLSQYVGGFGLDDLGLSARDQEIIKTAGDKPFGMILVTGPTGSGKSTTLYALLKNINSPEVNITTIEDPVEYRVAGVNQIQVNPQTDLTFARGLRSVVRQDPDIILVGEIRDEETAEIAVNAALTGHLLLSTFHSNDAASAIPRMLDMGLEPFLLASTLEVVIAQRLVRKICNHCRYSETVNVSDLKKKLKYVDKYFDKDKISLYKGKGCPACANTGYSGRVAIFEFIEITEALENLIVKHPSAGQIWELAQSEGAKSLF
ncbi:MAG: ATPase, T2SS/T4P/T4SS family, partial [Candidatus Magasanikbacteria bacterium]|nr:ATPase, T2SS/T4P/T4SS family [Candidatus Magasanikbacteria bacterium]